MALVKYRENEVIQEHLVDRAINFALPIVWVRDNLKVGDKVALCVDADNPEQLVITIVRLENEAVAS